uniref:Conserved oligomeric Golgi complex subunit 7 n=1 Tax=Heligmosomoides polygyrus TaxID=6339 RepID=A0A183FCZ6_HELPZ
LENYNVAVDNVNCDDPAIDEILQRVTAHVDATLDLIDKAQDTLTTLSRLSEELKSNQDKNFLTPPPCTPVANLTPLPIPKFDGKIWEWENFWNAFNYSVHSQNIDNMYKMTYLLDALEGEAKEFVKQYQISSQTYPLVIAHLKDKYGDNQAL